MNEELAVSLGNKKIAAKGIATTILLGIIAIVSANLYVGFRVEAALEKAISLIGKEHTKIFVSQDRVSCIITLPQEERDKFRATYTVGAFSRWCPWIVE